MSKGEGESKKNRYLGGGGGGEGVVAVAAAAAGGAVLIHLPAVAVRRRESASLIPHALVSQLAQLGLISFGSKSNGAGAGRGATRGPGQRRC